MVLFDLSHERAIRLLGQFFEFLVQEVLLDLLEEFLVVKWVEFLNLFLGVDEGFKLLELFEIGFESSELGEGESVTSIELEIC